MEKKKKGSALIYVILLLAVLFTVCVGVMEISLTSLKQSTNYNNKNSAFYHADNTLERILYYIDLAADDGRKKANDYCFLPGGGPNLDTAEIATLYEAYLEKIYDAEKNAGKDNDIEEYKKKVLEEFNKQLKNVFVREYKNNLNKFFNDMDNGQLSININNVQSNYTWSTLESFFNTQLKSDDDVKIEFERYGEKNPSNTFTGIRNIDNSDKFENFDTASNSYPRETLYIKVHMNKSDVTRYLISTFELNPFGVELDKVGVNTGVIKRGYNKLLDYGLVSDKNLIVVNENNMFNINGDVYVRGSSNEVKEIKPSQYFGGIMSGMDADNLSKLGEATNNPINEGDIPLCSGRLKINGNAYVGDVETDNFAGGFVKTMGVNSSFNITNDLYCHSIVTEKSGISSNIKVNGSTYIADNVSLNALNSKINIDGSLIGFETAESNTNYNQSPSVVVNDTTSRLYVGHNVVLFGTAFVDGLYKMDDTQNAFQTFETSAIYPNYIAYSYHINDKDNKDKFDECYSAYSFKDTDNQIEMLDRSKTNVDKGVNFLLQYINGSLTDKTIYDNPYNFAYDGKKNIIDFPNIKFNKDTPNDTSYFSALLTANNKVYVRGINVENEIDIKTNLNDKYERTAVNAELENEVRGVVDKIKNKFLIIMKLRDKGLANANGMDSYVSWSELDSKDIKIVDDNKKYFIWITSKDIVDGKDDFNLVNYDGWNILLISKGNIFLNPKDTVNISGNIIAKGDIVVQGRNISLNSSVETSKKIMNYFNPGKTDECQRMYKFFTNGATDSSGISIISAFKRNVKTNIKILSRRQIVK